MAKQKIAIVLNKLEVNGITSVILSYCSNLDLSKFEIIIFAGTPIDNNVKEKFLNLNIQVEEIFSRYVSRIKYYIELLKKLKSQKFDVIHINGNSTIMFVDMLVAFISGIKKRVAHCHSANCSSNFFNFILKVPFNALCTECLACSEEAGKWVYLKKFKVIPNAFDVNKFIFNKSTREMIRKDYNLSDEIVIGHTGRFNYIKNHEFIVEFVKKLIDNGHNIKCMFVGDGPDYNDIKNKVEGSKYNKNFIFVGETLDVYKYYNAMDLFVFPSKFEGLGISLLEAQLNGLPCIASVHVPRVAAITDNVEFLEINSTDCWTELIENKKNLDRKNIDLNDKRIKYYNINESKKILEQVYENDSTRKVRL